MNELTLLKKRLSALTGLYEAKYAAIRRNFVLKGISRNGVSPIKHYIVVPMTSLLFCWLVALPCLVSTLVSNR